MAWLQRFEAPIFAVFRFIFGLLFFCHGAQKVLGLFGGMKGPLPPLIQVGGWIEVVAGVLIALGLFGAIAAFIASGEMAVAYFMAHAPNGFWPIQNHGEAAVLYCFAFLYIAAHGSGPYSLDGAIGRGRR